MHHITTHEVDERYRRIPPLRFLHLEIATVMQPDEKLCAALRDDGAEDEKVPCTLPRRHSTGKCNDEAVANESVHSHGASTGANVVRVQCAKALRFTA